MVPLPVSTRSQGVQEFPNWERDPQAVGVEAALCANRDRVASIAYRLWQRLPGNIELDDLIQEGMIALWRCLLRYDAARDAQLMTFASRRIEGAMVDFLRATDPLTRPHRQEHKDDSFGASSSLEDWDGACHDPEPRELSERYLKTLTRRERTVILQLLAGAERIALAEAFDLTPGRISQHIKDATRKIRCEMA